MVEEANPSRDQSSSLTSCACCCCLLLLAVALLLLLLIVGPVADVSVVRSPSSDARWSTSTRKADRSESSTHTGDSCGVMVLGSCLVEEGWKVESWEAQHDVPCCCACWRSFIPSTRRWNMHISRHSATAMSSRSCSSEMVRGM